MNGKRVNGFSLVELAVVLFVGSVLFLTTPLLLQSLTNLTVKESSADSLQQVEEALLGFILQEGRLPYASNPLTQDGLENQLVTVGKVPYRTLGLTTPPTNPLGHELGYAVFSGNQREPLDLTRVPATRFTLHLPEWYRTAHYTPIPNGLDFCMALVNASQLPELLPQEPGVRTLEPVNEALHVAFLLVDPGRDGVLDPSNQGPLFRSPGTSRSNEYDDKVVAMGFGELSALLNCPALLARVNTSARDAFAADDLARLATWYRDFRGFGLSVREDRLATAERERDKTIAKAVFFVVESMVDLAMATIFGPHNPVAPASYKLELAVLIVATGMLAVNTTMANLNVEQKAEEVAAAAEQLAQAQNTLEGVIADRDERIYSAIELEKRGFFQ